MIFHRYTQDIDVARYMIWQPHNHLSETRAFVAGCIDAWNSGKRKPFMLTLPSDDENPLGMLDAFVSSHTATIGYVLSRQYWRNGYGHTHYSVDKIVKNGTRLLSNQRGYSNERWSYTRFKPRKILEI